MGCHTVGAGLGAEGEEGERASAGAAGVDPTRSTSRRDSLLNGRKMWVDFRILENPSSRRTVFFWRVMACTCGPWPHTTSKVSQQT